MSEMARSGCIPSCLLSDTSALNHSRSLIAAGGLLCGKNSDTVAVKIIQIRSNCRCPPRLSFEIQAFAQSRIHGVKFARFSGRVDATEAGSDRVSNKSVRAENVVVKNKP